jgi:hypothetical protein
LHASWATYLPFFNWHNRYAHVSSYYMHTFICFIIGELQYSPNLGVIKLINIQEIGWKTLIMYMANTTTLAIGCHVLSFTTFSRQVDIILITCDIYNLKLVVNTQISCNDCSTILKSIWSPKSSWQPIILNFKNP